MENKNYKLVSASWCGPCKLLKSQLQKENIEIDVIDVDQNMEYVQNLGIRAVPTLVVDDSELITNDIFKFLKENI